MKKEELLHKLENHELDASIQNCIVNKSMSQEIERYKELLAKAENRFGAQDWHLFSAPGRTEVGGNHTDHQQGRVLAASVNMDIVAAVSKAEDKIEFVSEDFVIQPVSIDDLAIKEEEKNTSEALIRGIVARFKALGYQVGGFKAYSNSQVLPGSGISSSAAFETMIGTILSYLYNDGKVSPVEIAQIGQYAENVYFKKPCGLMDQMACSVGGFITIDFKEKENPKVEKVDFDFGSCKHGLCLVDTKGDHADLSEEYGLMPKEMKDVAHVFDKEVMSQVTMEEFLERIDEVRSKTSDRACLRAYHFLNETERVLKEVDALKQNDIETFKKWVIESGRSSWMYLQNVSSTLRPFNQELAVALAISESMLQNKGAWRVHGGGLAGTIQAFVPNEMLEEYKEKMEQLFGKGSCHILSVRSVGGIMLI